MQRYETALAAGRYDEAWSLLLPQAQQEQGSLEAFSAERRAFVTGAGGFVVAPPTDDPARLRLWLGTRVVSADLSRARLVRVEFPLVSAFNQFEMYVAAPDPQNHWRLWQVR